ncbi:Fic family protein [Candidatus Peregrinibacteria bacterium]|nr:Fic family protein [Candidatus Peregrinibacteria bacterium]
MLFSPTYSFNLPLLPPQIDLKEFANSLLKARTEIAELKGYSFSMPNPMLLISPSIIRESVASSNIENINTTLIEVLQNELFPEAERRTPDKEVLRYRDAVLWGFKHIKSVGLSTRLILGIQKQLIPEGHGDYRTQQNKIINSTTNEVLYMPPAVPEIPRLMSNWKRFVNEPSAEVDPLIRAAIAHYQFESIHPFSDGNGRTGRILMVMQLIQDEIITLPILYISGYINNHRSDYYRLLREVTAHEKWNEFISFMLEGFYLQARETKDTLFKMMKLHVEFKETLKKDHPKIYSADLVDSLFSSPVINPVKLGSMLGIHYMTASRYLVSLAKSKLLKEGKYGRYHLFINERLLNAVKK